MYTYLQEGINLISSSINKSESHRTVLITVKEPVH